MENGNEQRQDSVAINVTNVNVNGAPDSNREKVDDNRICSDPNGGSFHVFGLFPIRKTNVWHFGVVVKFFLFNVLLLVLDIGTDVKTALVFYESRDPFWCSVTVSLILAPFFVAILINVVTRLVFFFNTNVEQHQTESFSNVLWQFPLLHIVKNLRLFISLLCMDTQLSINNSLVSKIKSEALPFGLFEAFLEAAPQLIFQLSLVLRTGYISSAQLWSIPISLISLTLSSAKLFYSQRLGRYADVDPPMKNLACIFPLILIQNIGFLIIWIVISAYLQGYAVLCVLFVMVVVCMALKLTNLYSEIETVDAVLDGIPTGKRSKETRKVFAIAILTSWVAPCSVMTNNKLNKQAERRFKPESKKCLKLAPSRFLCITSISSIIGMLICLLVTCTVISLCNILAIDKNPPVIHCFKIQQPGMCMQYVKGSINGTSSCIYSCPDSPCNDVIRACQNDESPTELFYTHVVPILVFILAAEIGLSFLLQKLGDYQFVYDFYKSFGLTIVHPTLINDWIRAKFQDELDRKSNEESSKKLECLLPHADKSILRQQDPISGKTCLHESFFTCQFKKVEEMMRIGANPFQKQNDGKSIDDMLQNLCLEKICEMKKRLGADIFTQKSISKDGKEFRLKVNIFNCNDEDSFKGKVVLQNDRGDEIISEPFSCSILLVLALCFMEEAGKIIETDEYGNIGFDKLRQEFKKLANHVFSRKEELQNLRYFYLNNPQFGMKQETGINWRCTNILHKYLETRASVTKLKFAIKCGANPEARNEKEETAFELFLRSLNNKIEQMPQNDETEETSFMSKTLNNKKVELTPSEKSLLWFGLQSGAARFATTAAEKDAILTIVKDRCFGGAKDKAILPPHLESIFIHAIAENDVESVKKFLDADFGNKGLNEDLRTPLHIAAKYGCLETMEVLIQSGANIQEKDIYKQAPIHFAAKHGSLNCLKCLIEKQANAEGQLKQANAQGQFKLTPLHLSAKHGHLDCVEFLLSKGANLKARGRNQQTPLHMATLGGHSVIVERLLEKNELLKKRPIVNLTDDKKSTALHNAARVGSLECVKLLLDKNAKLLKDVDGKTAIDVCAANDECREELMKKFGAGTAT